MSPEVDAFLKRQDRWKAELTRLRAIVAGSGLSEEMKWGKPCYTLEGKNVALLHGFKDYCAILFHKGALMKDPTKVLIQQTENVQAARQMRFTSLEDVTRLEKTVKAYMTEAIAIEKAGLRVQLKETKDFAFPEELSAAFAGNARLEAAFGKLTPGRQRGYLFHFAQAKLPKTRVARIEKNASRILAGLGLDD